jgi:hypothetical protein
MIFRLGTVKYLCGCILASLVIFLCPQAVLWSQSRKELELLAGAGAGISSFGSGSQLLVSESSK